MISDVSLRQRLGNDAQNHPERQYIPSDRERGSALTEELTGRLDGCINAVRFRLKNCIKNSPIKVWAE